MARFLETQVWDREAQEWFSIMFDLNEINVLSISSTLHNDETRLEWVISESEDIQSSLVKEQFDTLAYKIWGEK